MQDGLIPRIFRIVVFPLFSAAYLWQALSLSGAGPGGVSTRGFPVFIGVLMLAVAVTIAVLDVYRLRSGRAPEGGMLDGLDSGEEDTERITSWRDAWITVGALAAYAVLFEPLGFIVATATFLIGLSTYLAPRELVRNVVVSLAVTAVVYYAFVHLLQVSLPDGVLRGTL